MELEQFIVELAQKHPQIIAHLVFIGVLRAVFKPIMSVLEAYAAATPDKSDDEKLEKIKANRIYKGFAFLLDYVASIKLPK